ncbi:MAG: hypothetical protein KDI07_19345, partial [Anaerolineae bacterium]|nr:hypothetical protein [Anaerolineae bacterium]
VKNGPNLAGLGYGGEGFTSFSIASPQCRQRLEESRRMRLASLAMWPDPPHLDVLFTSPRGNRSYNAVVRFVFGLMHDQAHLDQIAKIVRQAEQARTGLTPPPIQ